MSRYLIFDSYGTLVEMDDFYGRLQAGFARLGCALPLDVVKRAARYEMHHYMARARFADDAASWQSLLEECAAVLKHAIHEQNFRLELPLEAVGQILADSVVFRAFPHARATLAELKERGYNLGVLSNWDFKLPVALESAGLGPFFDFVLTSAQAGVEKPTREFFDKGVALARRYMPGLKRKDCFYIGDHYEKDVLGARSAGLSPIWMLHKERDVASGNTHEAEDVVPRLSSLRDLLKIFS